MPKLYGWVREIVPESPADLAGVQPGDLVKAINGRPIRDLVDYQFYAAEEELLLGIERNGRALEILVGKSADEAMGIRFGEEPAPFIRICANKCVFCFIKGLPEKRQAAPGLPLGMRDTLYIKDDDYRYSFLFGNFITLTNLKEQDWQRLEEQRLSPLYVSVHTTNPELRRTMVDGPRSGEILEQLKRLGDLGITCHTQLVLCPGINDGAELGRSIEELAALRPIVESISVVPVGLTKYNNMLKVESLPPLRPYTVEEARAVVAQVAPCQQRFAAEPGSRGLPFVYLSDEWYYVTKTPFPTARHYGGYAQIENGVGMTRKLLDDWRVAKRGLDAVTGEQRPRIAIVTSTMAEPVLRRIGRDIARATGLEARVRPSGQRALRADRHRRGPARRAGRARRARRRLRRLHRRRPDPAAARDARQRGRALPRRRDFGGLHREGAWTRALRQDGAGAGGCGGGAWPQRCRRGRGHA